MADKYSKEMMNAHRARILQYEKLIIFAEDKSNSPRAIALEIINMRAKCGYCRAAGFDRRNTTGYDCRKCLLNGETNTTYHPCNSDGMSESYRFETLHRFNPDRKSMIKCLKERQAALVFQAQFNLGGG